MEALPLKLPRTVIAERPSIGSLADVRPNRRKSDSTHSLTWEMFGVEVKMLLDEPEVWVPVLAVILERCRGNNEATTSVLLRLVSLGLVQRRSRSQTPRPTSLGHPGPGAVSQTIRSPRDNRDRRTRRCRQPNRDLDA